MSDQEKSAVDRAEIAKMLEKKAPEMKRILSYCVHCSICAESCFLYMSHDGDPQYMPSYKVINSLGKLYKKKGNVDREFLEGIKGMVWNNCVLCHRCYCPIGIDIPRMIDFTRSICRSQDVFPKLDEGESWL
ncbi:MAG: (Fe-S)-binding protein [Pseudomonadota bacterium]|nr:(Fe-S)-binding protein [Pseudomonadota bacterium]